MALLQLDPLIPVLVKHKGEWVKAMAHVLIDYGFEHNLKIGRASCRERV